jgi:hypothetical protein
MPLRREQLNILLSYWTRTSYSGLTGTASTTIAKATLENISITKTYGGNADSPAVRGIITLGSYNIARLRNQLTGAAILDGSNNVIFGKLTYVATNYIVSYYTKVAGVDTATTLPGNYTIDMLFPEVMNISEVPFAGDLIDLAGFILNSGNTKPTFADILSSGNSTGTNDIELLSGRSIKSSGSVVSITDSLSVTGNLALTGAINSTTGLILSEQGSIPIPVAPNTGTIWVNGTNQLVYTNELNVSTIIGGTTGLTSVLDIENVTNGRSIELTNSSSLILSDNSVITSTDSAVVIDTNLQINGKLTVSDLIDPTGLVLDQQLSCPTTAVPGKGILWVKDEIGLLNSLQFTDGYGIECDLSTPKTLANILNNGNRTLGNNLLVSNGDFIVFGITSSISENSGLDIGLDGYTLNINSSGINTDFSFMLQTNASDFDRSIILQAGSLLSTGKGSDIICVAGNGYDGYGGNITLQVGSGTGAGHINIYSSGIYINNAYDVPLIDTPTGGFLYVDNGALYYKGSSGTITPIALA